MMLSGKKMPRVQFLTNELENEFGEGEDTLARHQHFTWHEKYLSVNVHQTIHDVLNFSQLFWCLIRFGDESWMITYLIILIYFIILHTYIPNELTQLGSQCEYDLTPWQHFSSTYRVVLCRIFSLNSTTGIKTILESFWVQIHRTSPCKLVHTKYRQRVLIYT